MFIGINLSLVSRLLGGGAYVVNGFDPVSVSDFVNNYFRVNGSATTFSGALSYTGASTKTMTDSAGVLKWGPHNLMPYSEAFESWTLTNATVTPNAAMSPFGTMTADLVVKTGADSTTPAQGITTIIGTVKSTVRVWVKFVAGATWLRIRLDSSGTISNAWVNYSTLVVGTVSGAISNVVVTAYNDGWSLVSLDYIPAASAVTMGVCQVASDGNGVGTGQSFYLFGAHIYRSDLGGMVNNPDTGISYVPTLASAVYLSRRGNYLWNGTAWANNGLLLESEARTNIALNSDALSTQSVTVTAVPYTLQFVGTGTVVLSGAFTGSLTGTGTGEKNRVYLTFTPTAGSLVLTVTGTVSQAQLEAGITPSSYIPTLGASVTRAAEILQQPSINLAVGANDVMNTSYWPLSSVQNGITATRVAYGIESDGLPFIDVRYQGTATAGLQELAYALTNSRVPAASGDTFTASMIARVIAGSTTGTFGLKCYVVEENAPTAFIGQTTGNGATSSSDTTISTSRTITTGNQARTSVVMALSSGSTIDVTYRIRGLQFDKAAARVVYPDQSNISMQVSGKMSGPVSTLTRWGGASTAYLSQSTSASAYNFNTNTNLALGADDFTNSTFWPSNATYFGITTTRTATGIDTDGRPYADFTSIGTATGTSAYTYNVFGAFRTPAFQNQTYNTGVILRFLSGTLLANKVSIATTGETSAGVGTGNYVQSASLSSSDTTDTLFAVTNTLTAATTVQLRIGIALVFNAGDVFNFSFRIKGLQNNLGSSRLTYTVRGGSFTSGVNVPFNIASRHGATYLNGAVGGTSLTASSSTLPFPVLNSSPIQLGSGIMGNILSFSQWNADIGDVGISIATAPPLLPSLSLTFDNGDGSFVVNDWS